jgi:hypothetical protein
MLLLHSACAAALCTQPRVEAAPAALAMQLVSAPLPESEPGSVVDPLVAADENRQLINQTLGHVQQHLGVSAICDTQVSTQEGQGVGGYAAVGTLCIADG